MKVFIKTNEIDILLTRINNIIDNMDSIRKNIIDEFYNEYKTVTVGLFRKKSLTLSNEEFNKYISKDNILFFRYKCLTIKIDNNESTVKSLQENIIFCKSINAEYIEISENIISTLMSLEKWIN